VGIPSAHSPFPARTAAPAPHSGIVAVVCAVLFCASVALFESMHGPHFRSRVIPPQPWSPTSRLQLPECSSGHFFNAAPP
jgi:hypothetical protein